MTTRAGRRTAWRSVGRLAGRGLQFSFFLALPLALILWCVGDVIARLKGSGSLAATVSLIGFFATVASGVASYLFYKLSNTAERIVRQSQEAVYSTSGTTADILYLRPFKIDNRPAGAMRTFEEILFGQLVERMVAVSDPKPAASGFGEVPRVRLPAGGALDVSWELYVAQLIRESPIVVLVCDWGADGFRRELQIIAEQKVLEKTIFITSILDHLGWSSLLASFDDEQLKACLETTPISDTIIDDFVERITKQMRTVELLSKSVPRCDWSYADPAGDKFSGVNLTSDHLQTFRAATEKAIALGRRPEWNIPIPSALLLRACGVPTDCIIMIHSLIINGTVGLTFRNGLRLWNSSRIAEARIQMERQTFLQIVWFLLKELPLMGSNRAQLEEARELAGLFDEMVRHVSQRTQ